MSHKRAKVLMVGPVAGRLRLLSDKLRTLQRSRAGPFDVCLCAGPFFHHTTTTAADARAATVKAGEAEDSGTGDAKAGGDDPRKKEQLEELGEAATKDGKDLADGSLTFDIPVLFVDAGDGIPDGIEVTNPMVDALRKDDDEIDLDDDEEEGDEATSGDSGDGDARESEVDGDAAKTPDGLLRIAPNLYQLVGDARQQSRALESVADIVSVPLPLIDPQQPSTAGGDDDDDKSTAAATTTKKKIREHATSLTIGFLGPKIRLPCPAFVEKAKHASFLGCDVLVSGEWGQGMSSAACGALAADDRTAMGFVDDGGVVAEEVGSYDVAELVAFGRPRYHVAPGAAVPVQLLGEDGKKAGLRRRFVASLPYRHPVASAASAGGGSHAGRFLAMGSVMPAKESKALGKAFKFIHAVGIVPLAYMDANDREAAREASSAVDCPYTDASYGADDARADGSAGMGHYGNGGGGGVVGGLSEAKARRLAQEDAASALGAGGGPGGAYRWQQRNNTRKRARDGEDCGGPDDEEARRQATEARNPDNCSLFLHGLHRDPGMALTPDALMDAFRPFGCACIRFPKPKTNVRNGGHYQQHGNQRPSYAFLDFNTHEEASQCLADLRGEAVVCGIALTLKWSSSPGSNKRPMVAPMHMGGGIPPPPPPKRHNRLTEAEAADSTTLFLRLPPLAIEKSSYPPELETMRLLAQGTMEDELNVGVSLDSPDRVTAKDEPALRVEVRQPNVEMNYGFLEFCSHAAALTTLVALTGHEDGGEVAVGRLETSCLIDEETKSERRDLSHLRGVTLYWAKGGGNQQKSGMNDASNPHGLKFNKRHFPPDSRTDCWFCLASPTCEKHLIVAVYDEIYVAMPKGGVNDHHALIVPVEHGGDGALVDRKIAPEMERIKAKLRLHARTALNKDLFVFERCIQTRGGYHTHVQCVPVEADSGPAIRSKMLEMASGAGFSLKEITSDLGLNALEDDWSGGYFYAEIPLPGGGGEYRRFIHRAGENGNGNGDANGRQWGGGGGSVVPLQFGREVLAEVLGNPDIGQWKACVVSKEKEEELTAEFRKSLSNVPAS